jgi:hypothetical protein
MSLLSHLHELAVHWDSKIIINTTIIPKMETVSCEVFTAVYHNKKP